jgi:hypothetical protein
LNIKGCNTLCYSLLEYVFLGVGKLNFNESYHNQPELIDAWADECVRRYYEFLLVICDGNGIPMEI